MATLKQRGKNWILDVRENGVRRRLSLGPNERLANLRLNEILAAHERGKAGFPEAEELALEDRVERWLEEHRANLAPSTYLRCQQYAERAFEHLGRPCHVTAAALERYKAARLADGAKAKSINNELAWLKQIHGAHGAHPFRDVRPLKIRDQRPFRWLTSEEVCRLLAAAPEPVRPYLLGYLYTGARRGELVALTWRDWNRRAGTLRLPNLKTAGRRPGDSHRLVPVHRALRAVLTAQEAAGAPSPFPSPSSQHQLRKWVVAAAQRAGITPLPTLHDLRHTFASHLVQAGVSLYVVGKLLGHTNAATTQIYAHLAPENFAAAMGLLNYATDGAPGTGDR